MLLQLQTLCADGLCTVYLAQSKATKEYVAIKCMHLGYDWSVQDDIDVEMETQGAFVAARELLHRSAAGERSQEDIRVFGAYVKRDRKGKHVDDIAHVSVAEHIRKHFAYDDAKLQEVKIYGLYLSIVMEYTERDLATALLQAWDENIAGREGARSGQQLVDVNADIVRTWWTCSPPSFFIHS